MSKDPQGSRRDEQGVVDVPMDCSPEAPSLVYDDKYEDISSIYSSNLQSLVKQLRKENGEMKDLTLKLFLKTSSMERKLDQLVDFQDQLHQLKGRVTQLESQLSTSTSIREPFDDELQPGVDELVFISGGYDGTSWLSSFVCYSPSRDFVKFLKPMSCTRSFAGSATLNGNIYIFGGEHDHSWFDTVESYNPLTNEWTSCPSLLKKKGRLAGATLHNKVYAIGGGNKHDNLSDVEMFDPSIGRWIPAQSMLEKRIYLAAVELNNVIYAVGGFDGKKFLNSAERYDPREASWSRLQGMNTRRISLSLAVLNEKLYALGGLDGRKMIPTVEVFDPRIGTWMACDEMKEARGAFFPAVMRETIYVCGGVHSPGNLLDTVECYKEGQGWQVTNLKGFQKRAFFDAVVL